MSRPKGAHLHTPWVTQATVQVRGQHPVPNQLTQVGDSMTPRSRYGKWQDNRGEDTRQAPAQMYGEKQDNMGDDTRQTPARAYGDRQSQNPYNQGYTPVPPQGVTAGGSYGQQAYPMPHNGDRPRENTRGPDSRGGARRTLGGISKGVDRRLSKTLIYVLRHGASKWGLKVLPGGFVYVDELLSRHPGLSGYTLKELTRLVEVDVDKRFTLERDPEHGWWKIKANQGHSIDVGSFGMHSVEENTVVHAYHYTTMLAWWDIEEEGLRADE
ncbi:TRPT1 [Mytilus coruscus]|uniref:2'-phosphotransferase n=1 Tax=Mytilus coruscus TaxID=42192 RepID=A0A6J8EP72_MYTCO|nr:TRPT1 [Mytilus coruscus]